MKTFDRQLMNELLVKVANKQKEAEDIYSFELVSVGGEPLPPFSAGSHIDVHIRENLTRQYSLCNDPSQTHRYLIGVLRDPKSRGGSVAMHDEVMTGDVLKISAPKNHFALLPATRTILFAGGIGVTPILCMAERLAKSGANFEMHYSSRSPERTAFQSRILASPFADQVTFHFDSGAPEQKLDIGAVLAQRDVGTHLYVCGPGGFIEHVLAGARELGWASERVHFEYFAATAHDASQDESFEVKVASTGEIVPVPAGMAVTAALAQRGIAIPISCEQGVCGTCVTRILAGLPDHRDMYLTEAERSGNDMFTPCCSRSKTKLLVLDI